MTIELIDELEAGELSIEFEGEEPQAVLAWAIERFGSIAISTSFQADSVALIDMAYEIDPEIQVFSVDTGKLPAETHELAARLRARYPGLNLDCRAVRRRGRGDDRQARRGPDQPAPERGSRSARRRPGSRRHPANLPPNRSWPRTKSILVRASDSGQLSCSAA